MSSDLSAQPEIVRVQTSFPDYARLLATLRDTESLVREYASKEPYIPALDVLADSLAESIAQLETLSDLSAAINQMRANVDGSESPE